MKGLYISNQEDPVGFFQRGLKVVEIESLILKKSFWSAYDLWLVIKSKKPDFIILNSSISLQNKNSDKEFVGVEFLRYLRMLGFAEHCICFGHEPLSQMINKNIGSAILLSDGNSYIIPYQDKLHDTINLDVLKTPATNGSLFELVKGTLNVEDVRHEWANYWGIYRLFETHQLIDKKFNGQKIEDILPENLKQKLFSYEGVALNYLNHTDNFKAIKELSAKINYCNILRSKLKNYNPKILYIDDQADFGWSEILQEIIYGGENALEFKTIKPTSNFNEEKLINKLYKEIVEFEPHFLLLDVRLRNEKNLTANPDELSGLKLLTILRKQIPNIPVIMFTASNKAKTIIRCKESGAYNVWTKEGIDERLSDADSLDHYIDLVELIYNCVSFVSERANKFLFGLEFPLAHFEAKLTSGKFQKLLDKLQSEQKFRALLFNQFDICILDTNIFLYNGKLTLTYYKTLLCLFDVLKLRGKKARILNATYDEMIKHAKYHYNRLFTKDDKDIRCKAARFALNKLQEFNDKKLVYVNNLTSTFDTRAYADPEFATLIHENIIAGNKILFVTNDNALREEIFDSVANIFSRSQDKNYRLMKGNDMIARLKPIVNLIDNISK